MMRSSQFGQIIKLMARAQQPAAKPRVSNAERRRTSIASVLDGALSLFVTKGYDATSIDDIASQAGLTKGAVYFYFKDKLALAGALLERTEAELFDPIFTELKASNTSPTDRIVMLTNRLARIGAERIELPLLHVLLSLEFHGRDNAVETHPHAGAPASNCLSVKDKTPMNATHSAHRWHRIATSLGVLLVAASCASRPSLGPPVGMHQRGQ